MHKVVRGVILKVVLMSLLVGVIGILIPFEPVFYSQRALRIMFWSVIAIEFAFAVWILSASARHGFGYIKQVATILSAFALAAVLMPLMTFLNLGILNPDYADQMVEVRRHFIEQRGDDPANYAEQLQAYRENFKPHLQMFYQAVITLITGVGFAVILPPFIRAKKSKADSAAGSTSGESAE